MNAINVSRQSILNQRSIIQILNLKFEIFFRFRRQAHGPNDDQRKILMLFSCIRGFILGFKIKYQPKNVTIQLRTGNISNIRKGIIYS